MDVIYNHWLQAIKKDKACALATILQTKETPNYQPLRVFVDSDGQINSSLFDTYMEKQLIGILKNKLLEKNPISETIDVTRNEDLTLSIFLDVYTPPNTVMIFGAGHDAIPVARNSVSLGYRTIVIDAREAFNTESHFPNTERIIAHTNNYKEKVPITKKTYVVIMNHHIEKDQATLLFALQSNAPYVGVLGPRSRRDRMMEHLQNEGATFTMEQLEKMHNPVGLDIGAETPEEIAISILAEIIAVQKNHQGGFLHDKDKIHIPKKAYKLK